jgi:hypothetical protein
VLTTLFTVYSMRSLYRHTQRCILFRRHLISLLGLTDFILMKDYFFALLMTNPVRVSLYGYKASLIINCYNLTGHTGRRNNLILVKELSHYSSL